MIEVTENQRQELKANCEPVLVLDPGTGTEYVLMGADVYTRFQQLLE